MSTAEILNHRTGRFACLLIVLSCLSQPVASQTLGDPEHEQLLNGLQILIWPKPGTGTVTLKLRIHSGAAFDLVGKAGEMALLGDILFPDRATIDYFEEMNGQLEVLVNYDSINITMEGRASELEKVIEVLRNALINIQLSPEVVSRFRDTRIKIQRETTVSPAVVADRAIASRLFGDFPYGRPSSGSPEDLGRIDRADLMLARDRFLNSNNATLAVVGDVVPSRLMRALRQQFGSWRKSDQIVPTTFRQPKPPEPRILIIGAATQTPEIRLALRGVSRSDPDFETANLIAKIAYHRWTELDPVIDRKPSFVRSYAYFLPGMFVLGTAIDDMKVADTITSARKVLDSMVKTPPSVAELDRARNEVLAEGAVEARRPGMLVNPWLDRDTYKLNSVPDSSTVILRITPNEIQRVATRLFQDAQIASVVVGDPLQLKAALQGHLQYEVFGDTRTPTTPPGKPGAATMPR